MAACVENALRYTRGKTKNGKKVQFITDLHQSSVALRQQVGVNYPSDEETKTSVLMKRLEILTKLTIGKTYFQ